MAELKCNDGTVVQISKETETELRAAFGSKLEFGDIVIYRQDKRSKRVVLYDKYGQLQVYSVSLHNKLYLQSIDLKCYTLTGQNIFTDDLLDLKRRTPKAESDRTAFNVMSGSCFMGS